MAPTLRHLLDLWRDKRARRDGLLPERRQFDPVEMGARLLPDVSIVEKLEGRLRFRLCGTGLAKAAGLDLTGAYIDELNPNRDYADYISGLYALAESSRFPVLSESSFIGKSAVAKGRTQRLICPLAYDGETVDHFITTQIFEREADALGDLTMTYAAGFFPGETRVIGDAA